MLKEAVQELRDAAGIGMANWNRRVVREFVALWFRISLTRSSCLNYLHRLELAIKRPKNVCSRGMRQNGSHSLWSTPP